MGRDSEPIAMDGSQPADHEILLFFPARDEEAAITDVITRAPAEVCGRRVTTLVIDDGSEDSTVERAERAGALVVRHDSHRGLGAAVRTGFDQAVSRGASVVAFCDADGEYAPEELEQLVVPILAGDADYVVGSRFSGHIEHMRPHRRLGNRILTLGFRLLTQERVTDGQSGYRALSARAAAAAEIEHDYNYAQVLTLDLLQKGFRYSEVPISYRFRTTGQSFIRVDRYLRHVIPAVWRVRRRRHHGVRLADRAAG